MILRPLLCTPAFGCALEYSGVNQQGHPILVRSIARCERHALLGADALVLAAIIEETEREAQLLRHVLAIAPSFDLATSARWIGDDGVLHLQLTGVIPAEALTTVRTTLPAALGQTCRLL